MTELFGIPLPLHPLPLAGVGGCGLTGRGIAVWLKLKPDRKKHQQRTNSFQSRVKMSGFYYTLGSNATQRKGGTKVRLLLNAIEALRVPKYNRGIKRSEVQIFTAFDFSLLSATAASRSTETSEPWAPQTPR